MSVRTGMSRYHFEVSRTAMYRVRYVLASTSTHDTAGALYCLVPGVQDLYQVYRTRIPDVASGHGTVTAGRPVNFRT
jgi:hypothetical protein